LPDDRFEPGDNGLGDRSTVAQRMRTGDENDPTARRLGRGPERVALALDDQRRDRDGVELLEAALLRLARWMDREREAENGHGLGLRGGTASDARACRAAADDQRHPREELRHDREPGRVELPGRRGAPPPGDAVGLLHERDTEPGLIGSLGRPNEVRRLDPAARPVPEHERGMRRVRRVDVRSSEAVRRVELARHTPATA